MSIRSVVAILAVSLLAAADTFAQSASASGFLSVMPAVSAGDGGAAPSVSATAGYLTSRHIGFEVEVNYTDRLDLRDTRAPQIQVGQSAMMFGGFSRYSGFPFTSLSLSPSIFPPIDLSVSGRLLSFHTNAIGDIVATRRFRASVSGGGGVASLRQRTHMRMMSFSMPDLAALFGASALVIPGGMGRSTVTYPASESVSSSWNTGLSLNAGTTMEFRLTRHAGVAGDVHYQHVFLNSRGIDLARVGSRFVWRF